MLIGGLMYYLCCPDVLFVKALDSIIGTGFHIMPDTSVAVIRIIRYYLFDVIWANSLTVLVFALLGDSVSDKRYVLAVLIIFEVLMESIQLIPGINGTFDVFDIAAEILVNIIVINYISRREI